jgi:hypothetical protein
VKCVLGLPSEGVDPPMMSDDAGKKILTDVVAHLFPDQPSPKDIKINPNRAVEMIDMFNKTRWPNLDEDVCIRIFFMVLNNNFLTPNTYCYIRPVDTLWCHDRRAIASYNWCKIIYDYERSRSQVEGGSTSQNGHANSNGLFTISHGTNRCKSNSFPYFSYPAL